MLIRKNRFLSSASFIAVVLCLGAMSTPSHAGFEWTPPERTAPAPLPAPQVAPSHIPLDSSALPEVGDFEVPAEEPAEPRPQPVQQARPAPQPSGKMQTLDMSPERAPIPVNEQEPEPQAPVVMSAPVTPDHAPQAMPEPFPLTESHQGQDAILPAPAPAAEVQPPVVAEAPAAAGLSINPYPLESGQATPPAAVASAPAPEQINWHGDYEVIEGFGSEMPLALALQQVVPAQYAFSFGKGVNAGRLVSWEGGKSWDQVLKDMLRPLNVDARIEGNVVKIVSNNAPVEPAPAPAVAEEQSQILLAPLPDASVEQQEAAALAPEELKLEPVSEKEANNIAREAKALQDKTEIEAPVEAAAPAAVPVKEVVVQEAEPKAKKVSKSRNVILDPGESKPLEPASKAVKKTKEEPKKEEVAKSAAPASEAAQPSDAAIESAKTEPASNAAPAQLNQPRIWEAKRGSSLRDTLDSWAKQANVTLTWNAQDDVKLNSDILISGTFDNAVKVLFAQAVKNGPAHTLKTSPSAELVVGDQTASG